MNEMEKMPPDLVKHINEQQLKLLREKIEAGFSIGSPEYRKFEMQIKLMRKRNQKEFDASTKNKRRNPRFA
jgi:hypothetical protein